MSNKEYFKLYANCLLVNGKTRSIIVDVQHGRYIFVPKEFSEILEINRSGNCLLWRLIEKYDDETGGLNMFIRYLINNDFGFLTSIPNSFPDLCLDWDYPAVISNAVIIVSENSLYDFYDTLLKIQEIGVKAIQIRFLNTIKWQRFVEIISNIKNGDYYFDSIDLYLSYDVMNAKKYRTINRLNPIIIRTIVYNAPFDRNYVMKNLYYLHYRKRNIEMEKESCSAISPATFNVNISFYTESINYNSCLNRKLCIDENGKIKNCPASKKIFGDVSTDSLEKIVAKSDFRILWNIKKDMVEVCKDCEFRYICHDCRIILSDDNNQYSKPLKCKYNPYSAIWEK